MPIAMNGPLTTARRRGGRVVECTALEMRHTCKGIVGSNPTLSAILQNHATEFLSKNVPNSGMQL